MISIQDCIRKSDIDDSNNNTFFLVAAKWQIIRAEQISCLQILADG